MNIYVVNDSTAPARSAMSHPERLDSAGSKTSNSSFASVLRNPRNPWSIRFLVMSHLG
jgi:hypothetical protein